MGVLILWTLLMVAVQLLVGWIIYRLQGRKLTWAQFVLPGFVIVGGGTIILISARLGGWSGLGYGLMGMSILASGLLSFVSVVIALAVTHRRRTRR